MKDDVQKIWIDKMLDAVSIFFNTQAAHPLLGGAANTSTKQSSKGVGLFS
jgi:hypothetical protein